MKRKHSNGRNENNGGKYAENNKADNIPSNLNYRSDFDDSIRSLIRILCDKDIYGLSDETKAKLCASFNELIENIRALLNELHQERILEPSIQSALNVSNNSDNNSNSDNSNNDDNSSDNNTGDTSHSNNEREKVGARNIINVTIKEESFSINDLVMSLNNGDKNNDTDKGAHSNDSNCGQRNVSNVTDNVNDNTSGLVNVFTYNSGSANTGNNSDQLLSVHSSDPSDSHAQWESAESTSGIQSTSPMLTPFNSLGSSSVTFVTKSVKGKEILCDAGYEYWLYKCNLNGTKRWRCAKYKSRNCHLTLLTDKHNNIICDQRPEHNHPPDLSASLARVVVWSMKRRMTETNASASEVRAEILSSLSSSIVNLLPASPSITRTLQRERERHSIAQSSS